MQPAPEGQRLYEKLARLFDALQAACDNVARPDADPVLAVHCAPSLAINWLGPRLPAFLAANPGLNVRLTTGADVPDLDRVRDIHVAWAVARSRRNAREWTWLRSRAAELERGNLLVLGCEAFALLLRAVHFVTVRRAHRARPDVGAFVDWVLQADAAPARYDVLGPHRRRKITS